MPDSVLNIFHGLSPKLCELGTVMFPVYHYGSCGTRHPPSQLCKQEMNGAVWLQSPFKYWTYKWLFKTWPIFKYKSFCIITTTITIREAWSLTSRRITTKSKTFDLGQAHHWPLVSVKRWDGSQTARAYRSQGRWEKGGLDVYITCRSLAVTTEKEIEL